MPNYSIPFRNTRTYPIQEPSPNRSRDDQQNRVHQNLSRFEAFRLKYFAVREVLSLNFLRSGYSVLNYACLMFHLELLIKAYTEGESIIDTVLVISSILNTCIVCIRIFKFYVGFKYIEEKTLLLCLDIITGVLLFAFYGWGISLMNINIEIIHHSYVKFYNTTLDDKNFYNATFYNYEFHNAPFHDYRKFYNASTKEQLVSLIYNELYGSEALVSIHFLNMIIFIVYSVWALVRLNQTIQDNEVFQVAPSSRVGSGNPICVTPAFLVHSGPGPSAKIKKPILGFTSTCSTISERTEKCSTQDSITHSTIGYVDSEYSSGTSSYTHDTKGETIPVGYDLSKNKGKSTKSSAKDPTNYPNIDEPSGSTLKSIFHYVYESDQTSTNTSLIDKSNRFKVNRSLIDNKGEEVIGNKGEEIKANVQEFTKKNEIEKSINEEGKNPSNIKETEAGPSGLQLSNRVKSNIKDEASLEMTENTDEEKLHDFETKTNN